MADIERARALYEQGKYSELSNACAELIQDPEHKREARILYAKGIIQVMGPKNEKLNNSYTKIVLAIGQETETLKELFDIEHDLKQTLEHRRVSFAKQYAASCLNKPDFEEWKRYFQSDADFIMQKAMTEFAIAQGGLKRFADEKGIGLGDFRKENQPEYQDDYDAEDDRNAVLLESADQLFEKGRAIYAANDDCSADAAKILCERLVKILVLSELQCGFVTPDAEEGKDELRFAALMKKAEIMDWKLRTVVHFEGKQISLYCGDRASDIAELNELYEQISALNPQFIAPPLPQEAAIMPAAAQASGGCYVATAVYGSYDCPQVWTLRRFRDDTLAATWYGRLFIRTYYAISPTMVKWFGKAEWFQNIFRPRLDRLVMCLNGIGVEGTPYSDKKW